MMSSGFMSHGWQAVARAPMFASDIPKSPAKFIFVLPFISTRTELTGLQPGTFGLHEVMTDFVMLEMPLVGFSAKYWLAREIAFAELGSSCAPARAAASTVDCSSRFAYHA